MSRNETKRTKTGASSGTLVDHDGEATILDND
jgi:hypothetical protein